MRIEIQWPTRGCPDGLAERHRLWVSRQSHQHQIHYNFSVDEDDADSIAAARRILHRAASLPETTTAGMHVGKAAGKIAACNAGIRGPESWDVIILASDDFTPEAHGWDDVVARAMSWHFPAMDGFLHFPDGYSAHDRFPTIPIMGSRLYRRFGYIYNPAYESLWCDREQGEVMCMLHKSHYVDLTLFQHRWRGTAPDETLKKNQMHWRRDEGVFNQRARERFGVEAPMLSLLVASLDSRRATSEPLFREIYRQIFDLPTPWAVELHVLLDQKRRTVGEKRQILLGRARGKYVAYIDDDDRISRDYVASILEAITKSGHADCVTFMGEYRENGSGPRPFDYDLKYLRYRNTPDMYERTPNHLCPVKTELARRVGFNASNCGEDTDYARRLRPLLRNQAVCLRPDGKKKVLYYYDFNSATTETQRVGAVGGVQ